MTDCITVVENLSQREKNSILSVLQRDEQLRNGQEQKISDLRLEINKIRMCSVLRSGDDQSKMCLRCRAEMGILFNRGALCPSCKFKVCKTCQEVMFNGSWLCKLCYKQRQLKWLTGEWAASFEQNPLRKWASGSDLIKSSLKLVPGTTSIEIDEPPSNREAGNQDRKVSRNGVKGSDHGRTRVEVPKEGDQLKLSELFNVLRVKKPDEVPAQETKVRRVVTSRKYSESDSDSSSNSDEEVRSTSTAPSVTESELDVRRFDSPRMVESPPPHQVIKSRLETESPRRPAPILKVQVTPDNFTEDHYKPVPAPRSPKPADRRKANSEHFEQEISALAARPRTKHKTSNMTGHSGEPEDQMSMSKSMIVQSSSSNQPIGEIDYLDKTSISSELSVHVANTRESLDKKREIEISKSQMSLDKHASQPVEVIVRQKSKDHLLNESGENVDKTSSLGTNIGQKEGKNTEKIKGRNKSDYQLDKNSGAELDIRKSASKSQISIKSSSSKDTLKADDSQQLVSSQKETIVKSDKDMSAKAAIDTEKAKLTREEHLPVPRAGSPYSVSMDSIPSSHPSPTFLRSSASSNHDSSDTDSISRLSHMSENIPSDGGSPARERKGEDVVVEQISKVHFKRMSKKVAQLGALAKLTKSPNKPNTGEDDLEVVEQRETQSRESSGLRGEGGGSRTASYITHAPKQKETVGSDDVFNDGEHKNEKLVEDACIKQEQSPKALAACSVTDMLIRKLELMENQGKRYSSTGSKSVDEMSWINEYDIDNETLNIELSHSKNLPRFMMSSVASESERRPSEADSIEVMIDSMTEGLLVPSWKMSEADSEAGLNHTPISPIPNDLNKRSKKYNKFAYISDDNLDPDSADDLEDVENNIQKDTFTKIQTSGDDSGTPKMYRQKKELPTMDSLDLLINQQGHFVDENEENVELDTEYENALKLTAANQEVHEPTFKNITNRKLKLEPKNSLDILVQQQEENEDADLENMDFDEELLASLETQFLENMATQRSSPLLNKEYAFLGVQHDFHKVSGTDPEKQVDSVKLEEIDSLAVGAKSYLERLENNHIAEPSLKGTKLPFISLLLDHGSNETSDSDMLSVIEEVDEDSDTSEDNFMIKKGAGEQLNVRAEGLKNLESDSTKARKKKTKAKTEEDTILKAETENKGKLYKKDSKAITESKKVSIHNHEKFKKIHDHFSALERHEADILDLEVIDSKEDNDSDKETQKVNTYEENDESNTFKMAEKDKYKNVEGTEIQLKDNLYLLSIKTAGTTLDNLLEDENSPSEEERSEKIINSTVNESFTTGSINESDPSCQSINDLKTSSKAFPDTSPKRRSTENHDISNNNNILYASEDLNKCLTNVEFTDNSETVKPTVLRDSSDQLEVNNLELSDGFTDGRCHSISDGSFKLIDNVIQDAKTCHSIDEQAQNCLDDVFEDEPNTTVTTVQVENKDVEKADGKESKEQRLNSDELGSEIKDMQLSQKQAVFKSAVEMHLDKGGRVTPPASVSNEFFKAPVRPPRTKTKGTPTPSSSVPRSPEHSTGIHEGCLDSPRSEMLAGPRDSPQTVSECSVSHDDSGNVSGGSRGTTPEHRRTDSSYSQSSIPSTLSTDEEDIDRAVARVQKQAAGNRGNLLSVFGDSRESLASYYSDAGDIAYSNIPVTGEILFSLNYNYKTSMLEVGVKQCRDIAVADSRRRRSDPYVKTYLLPDRTRGGKRKTKVKKHTLSPTFDETLKYSITKSELENRTLWITVWHNDRFGRNVFLGEVTINFDYFKFEDPFPRWYPLQERMDAPPASMMVYKGDMSLCIRFVPADKHSASPSVSPGKHKKEMGGKGQLQVKVKEARNLTAVKSNGFSDPFCKGYLLPERHKSSKQKTAVIKKDCNPTWNHTFIFEDVNLAELRERCLELTIWDYEKLSSNDFLGGVRLNLGTGLSQGKSVEWMDARGEEMSMWQAMLDRPNIWIDGALILRPNMEKRKY